MGLAKRQALCLLVCVVAQIGCTVTKPVACAIVYPVAAIAKGIEEDAGEGESEKYEGIGPVLALVSLPVVLPVAFVSLSALGVTGGLVSGFASDLNLVLGHANMKDSVKTLATPYRTNMRKRSD